MVKRTQAPIAGRNSTELEKPKPAAPAKQHFYEFAGP